MLLAAVTRATQAPGAAFGAKLFPTHNTVGLGVDSFSLLTLNPSTEAPVNFEMMPTAEPLDIVGLIVEGIPVPVVPLSKGATDLTRLPDSVAPSSSLPTYVRRSIRHTSIVPKFGGTTGTVTVSPREDGSSMVTYVHHSHPGELKVGDVLPATHPHSRAAHTPAYAPPATASQP